jgi:hypothetical protein
MIYELSVFHTWVPSQVIKQKPERRTIQSTLFFSQSIRHNIRTRKLSSQLGLTQSVRLRTSVYNLSVTSALRLSQTVGRNPKYLSVNHLLFHWQTVKRPFWEKVTSLFKPGQTVVGHGCRAVKSTLQFNQTVVGNVVRHRTISQNPGFISGVSAWVADPNFNFLNPTFTTIEKVRFKYGDYQFYLRKPDFDDSYSYDFTRINRRSRGGDLLISRDPIWPKTIDLNIRFTYLSQAEIDKLLYFMELSLGKRCRYLNYDNVEWEGFITNPQAVAQQVGRSNQAITIEFQGEPL